MLNRNIEILRQRIEFKTSHKELGKKFGVSPARSLKVVKKISKEAINMYLSSELRKKAPKFDIRKIYDIRYLKDCEYLDNKVEDLFDLSRRALEAIIKCSVVNPVLRDVLFISEDDLLINQKARNEIIGSLALIGLSLRTCVCKNIKDSSVGVKYDHQLVNTLKIKNLENKIIEIVLVNIDDTLIAKITKDKATMRTVIVSIGSIQIETFIKDVKFSFSADGENHATLKLFKGWIKQNDKII